MNILIIGGTRNLGHFLAERILADGHKVTILNRGVTRDDLSKDIARLRCDRTNAQQLRRAIGGRTFDVVIDNVIYKEAEAEDVVDILQGKVGHYIFMSTGQVYLVRDGVQRPFKESDYEGDLLPQPTENTYDYEEWLYGIDKRKAEAVFARAYEKNGFPYTALRMPMVNSERDNFNRLYNYMLRIKDGGPILVPNKPNFPLRHVYTADVVNLVTRLINTGVGKGKAYNISQDETVTLDEFLGILGNLMGIEPNIRMVDRALLEANGFLPECSPFSEMWMSELDNTLSKTELGATYTPLREYLAKIVTHYTENPPKQPAGYKRRKSEKNLDILPSIE
ncbi:MAG: NAD-dependent epimerase/dehydratase family protein [Phototrophicales bacterium]|nr:NAD-dependent epimerase/dehydratase family protein [Phototrophicales bacterium]